MNLDKTIRKAKASGHKNIVKQIKKSRLSIIAEPLVMKTILMNYIDFNKKSYIEHTLDSIIENINLFYTVHSTHEVSGDDALSKPFLMKYFSHFTEAKQIHKRLWIKTFIGTNLSKKCSSYKRILEPEFTVFVKEQEFKNLILDVLSGRTSMEEYEVFYNRRLAKQKSKNKEVNGLLGLNPEIFLGDKKFIKKAQTKTVRTQAHKVFNLEFKSKIVELLKNETDNRNKNDLKKLLLGTEVQGDELIFNFELSTSIKSDRMFHPLNSISKGLRAKLFGDYLELDVENMAVQYIYNTYNSVQEVELNAITQYLERKTYFRNRIAEEFNISVTEAKIKILKILFGSTDARDLILPDGFKSKALSHIMQNIKSIATYISEEENLTMKQSYVKISTDYMKVETEINNTLLKDLGLTRADVIDVHDGILFPKSKLNKDSIDVVQKIESQFGYVFGGKEDLKREFNTPNTFLFSSVEFSSSVEIFNSESRTLADFIPFVATEPKEKVSFIFISNLKDNFFKKDFFIIPLEKI